MAKNSAQINFGIIANPPDADTLLKSAPIVGATLVDITTAGRLRLYELQVTNSLTTDSFLQLFGVPAAAPVTPGTTVADAVFRIPGSGTLDIAMRGIAIGADGAAGACMIGTTTATGATESPVSVNATYKVD